MKSEVNEGMVNGAGKDCAAEAEKEFSFPKGERILKSQDFTRVRKDGKRIYSRSFTVFILSNTLGKKRLGLSVGAKVADSPGRNRVKRLIREFFRLNKGSFPESSDVLISVKTVENIKGYGDLEEEFKKVLMRLL